MFLNRKKITIKYMFRVMLLLFFVSLISACADQQGANPKPPVVNGKKDSANVDPKEEWKLPIASTEGEFYKAVGWLSDDQLLYITNLEQTSSVYRYDLQSGKSDLIYKSDVPIVNLQISPSKKYILIHSAPSTYEGLITVISADGTELRREAFSSYELAIEWNPFNESEILITSFYSDWTYQIQLLDIEKNIMTEITLPQPFVKWINQGEIAFLNWDENSPALSTQLIKKKIAEDTELELLPSVLQIATYHDVLMAVIINNQDNTQATYSFFENDMKEIFSFTVPHLSMFSGWLVPFFDYNESKGQFVTLIPLRSGDADAYHEDFELVSYDIKKGIHKTILGGLKNEPILLSPSGKAALYGNQLEKIIDLSTKKIIELVK